MATVNGGKALWAARPAASRGLRGRPHPAGQRALNLIPCHDAANNLAYAAHGSNVVMNMARGKVIYKNGEFLTIDIER
ncbi:MAG: hypothetical protein ACLRWQ_17695 [Flavonifractor plautii]